MLISRGYPESFCDLVTKNLNTDFTASRMIGYLCHYSDLPPEEIADEMLAILSDRNRIMQKKELESNNAEWNRILMPFSYLAFLTASGNPSEHSRIPA